MRAVRFNLYRGGSATLADVDTLARRVHDLAGWHSEFYLDAADLADLESQHWPPCRRPVSTIWECRTTPRAQCCGWSTPEWRSRQRDSVE